MGEKQMTGSCELDAALDMLEHRLELAVLEGFEKPRGLPLEGVVAVVLRGVHGVARHHNEMASETQPFGGWCEQASRRSRRRGSRRRGSRRRARVRGLR